MKILKLTAVFMALCLSLSVQAICPPDVQKAAIFYINGIANYTESQAASSKDELEQRLKAHPKYNPDCVTVDLAYNQDELFIGNIFESAAQKSEELVIPLSRAMGMLFRVVLPDTWFGDVIADVYARNTSIVDPAQRDKHLAKYRPVLDAGTQVILVSHSQGGFFANDEWNNLTPLQQLDTHIVTVVTPAFSTADGGPNTRIREDLIAKLFFPLAPLPDPPDFSNTEPCADTLLSALTLLRCHSFIESYMHGTNSRMKIVNDIVALMTPTPLGNLRGKTFRLVTGATKVLEGGVTVTFHGSDNVTLAETVSAGDGTYNMVVPECRVHDNFYICYIKAQKPIGGALYTALVRSEILPGATTNVDINITPCGGPDITPPTTPGAPIASNITSNSLTLNWTAAADNCDVTGYRLERCRFAGCTTFTQLATPTTNSYSDINLSPLTSYTYRVRSADGAGNTSAYSSTASTTTLP